MLRVILFLLCSIVTSFIWSQESQPEDASVNSQFWFDYNTRYKLNDKNSVGGFAGYIAKTGDTSFENMKNAVIYGSTLASFCVEKFGTERMKTLTHDEVHKRLLQFKKLTQFDIKLT